MQKGNTSTLVGLEPYLQEALAKREPTPEEYTIATELQRSFTRINPQKPELQKDEDGFIKGDYEKEETALQVPPNRYRHRQDMVINGRGQLLIISGFNSREATAVEILQHGQEIIEAIRPERLTRLQGLITQVKTFNWDQYVPPTALEHLKKFSE